MRLSMIAIGLALAGCSSNPVTNTTSSGGASILLSTPSSGGANATVGENTTSLGGTNTFLSTPTSSGGASVVPSSSMSSGGTSTLLSSSTMGSGGTNTFLSTPTSSGGSSAVSSSLGGTSAIPSTTSSSGGSSSTDNTNVAGATARGLAGWTCDTIFVGSGEGACYCAANEERETAYCGAQWTCCLSEHSPNTCHCQNLEPEECVALALDRHATMVGQCPEGSAK